MKICDLININKLSVNFDLQVKYFLHIHCWETPQIRTVGSAPASGYMHIAPTSMASCDNNPVYRTVSFVFLAAIFHITIHFKLNFMFLGKICLNTIYST